MLHCDSGVFEAGMPIRSVALLIWPGGIRAMKVLDCAEQNSDGRHGLMYFDIILRSPRKDIIIPPPPHVLY